jgi:hypothetical protein
MYSHVDLSARYLKQMCRRVKRVYDCGKADYSYPKCDYAKARDVKPTKCPNYDERTNYEGHIGGSCSSRCRDAYEYGWTCHLCDKAWAESWRCSGVHRSGQVHKVCGCKDCIVNRPPSEEEEEEEESEEEAEEEEEEEEEEESDE